MVLDRYWYWIYFIRFHSVWLNEKSSFLFSKNKFARLELVHFIEISKYDQSNSITECLFWNAPKPSRKWKPNSFSIPNRAWKVKHNDIPYIQIVLKKSPSEFDFPFWPSFQTHARNRDGRHSFSAVWIASRRSTSFSRRAKFKQRKNEPHISCFSPFETTTTKNGAKTSCERVKPLFCRCCCYCCDDNKSRQDFN